MRCLYLDYELQNYDPFELECFLSRDLQANGYPLDLVRCLHTNYNVLYDKTAAKEELDAVVTNFGLFAIFYREDILQGVPKHILSEYTQIKDKLRKVNSQQDKLDLLDRLRVLQRTLRHKNHILIKAIISDGFY